MSNRFWTRHHLSHASSSRRMMMTSGSGVNYKSMFDAGSQIIAKEGTKSLFKGAGANILRGVAGAGVLSLYDKLQQIMFGKVYSGGMLLLSIIIYYVVLMIYICRIWLRLEKWICAEMGRFSLFFFCCNTLPSRFFSTLYFVYCRWANVLSYICAMQKLQRQHVFL